MEKKLGVYICEGCGIGEALDIERLKGKVPPKIKICKTHPFLCGPDGVNVVKQDIEGEGVNTAVIAACSRRVLYDVFDFGPVIVNRVNLREGVVWSHKPNEDRMTGEEGGPQVDEVIQEMAEDYLRMGIAEAEKLLPVEPFHPEEVIDKKILVLGGGVSGLSAALEVAKTGYEAVVIEKEASVGGFASKMRKQTPTSYPYEKLEEPAIGQIIADAESHPKIEIRTSTEVARIAGQPGLYDVTFKPAGTKNVWDVMSAAQEEALLARLEEEGTAIGSREPTPDEPATILRKNPDAERFGAVILATGWKPWELKKEEEPPAEEAAEGEGEGEKPAETAAEAEEAAEPEPTYEHLGFGHFPDVVTNVAFEEMAGQGKILRPSDGKPPASVAFIQSPGQGSDDDFPYTGFVTSMVALKQAKYVREDNTDGKAYIFYQHMRTPNMNTSTKAPSKTMASS